MGQCGEERVDAIRSALGLDDDTARVVRDGTVESQPVRQSVDERAESHTCTIPSTRILALRGGPWDEVT